jgi:hypothetical protein
MAQSSTEGEKQCAACGHALARLGRSDGVVGYVPKEKEGRWFALFAPRGFLADLFVCPGCGLLCQFMRDPYLRQVRGGQAGPGG